MLEILRIIYANKAINLDKMDKFLVRDNQPNGPPR